MDTIVIMATTAASLVGIVAAAGRWKVSAAVAATAAVAVACVACVLTIYNCLYCY